MSGVGLLRGRLLVLTMAIVAVLATGTWFALTRASAQESTGHRSAARPGPAASASAQLALFASQYSPRVVSQRGPAI